MYIDRHARAYILVSRSQSVCSQSVARSQTSYNILNFVSVTVFLPTLFLPLLLENRVKLINRTSLDRVVYPDWNRGLLKSTA